MHSVLKKFLIKYSDDLKTDPSERYCHLGGRIPDIGPESTIRFEFTSGGTGDIRTNSSVEIPIYGLESENSDTESIRASCIASLHYLKRIELIEVASYIRCIYRSQELTEGLDERFLADYSAPDHHGSIDESPLFEPLPRFSPEDFDEE